MNNIRGPFQRILEYGKHTTGAQCLQDMGVYGLIAEMVEDGIYPITATRLARIVHLDSSATTKIIKRLEEMDLLYRVSITRSGVTGRELHIVLYITKETAKEVESWAETKKL